MAKSAAGVDRSKGKNLERLLKGKALDPARQCADIESADQD